MILCGAGDIHGALDRMYAGVLAFEVALGVRFEWLLAAVERDTKADEEPPTDAKPEEPR